MVYPLAVWKTLIKRCAFRLLPQNFLCSRLLGAKDRIGIRKDIQIHGGISSIRSSVIKTQHRNPGDVYEEECLYRTFPLLILDFGTRR